jgi:acyl-CoA reductase-like NAD-dependent aldehyde dehydrogenase
MTVVVGVLLALLCGCTAEKKPESVSELFPVPISLSCSAESFVPEDSLAVVEGLRRVLSYTSERLVLQVGKRRVTLVGADLCLLDYSPLGVQVIGTLLAVEFGDL